MSYSNPNAYYEAIEANPAHTCEYCDGAGFVYVSTFGGHDPNGTDVPCGCRCHKDDSRGCTDADMMQDEEGY